MKLCFAVLEIIKKHGPVSCSQIGRIMGTSREVARNHVKLLSEMDPKIVYVADWTPFLGIGKGSSGAMWSAGDLPNVDRPEPTGRMTRARMNRDESEYTEARLKAELTNRAKLIKPFRDPMIFMTAGRQA